MSADPAKIHDHDYPAPDGHRFGPQLRSASVAWSGREPADGAGGIRADRLLARRPRRRGRARRHRPPAGRPGRGSRQPVRPSRGARRRPAQPHDARARRGAALDAAAFVTLGTIAMQSVRLTAGHVRLDDRDVRPRPARPARDADRVGGRDLHGRPRPRRAAARRRACVSGRSRRRTRPTRPRVTRARARADRRVRGRRRDPGRRHDVRPADEPRLRAAAGRRASSSASARSGRRSSATRWSGTTSRW